MKDTVSISRTFLYSSIHNNNKNLMNKWTIASDEKPEENSIHTRALDRCSKLRVSFAIPPISNATITIIIYLWNLNSLQILSF